MLRLVVSILLVIFLIYCTLAICSALAPLFRIAPGLATALTTVLFSGVSLDRVVITFLVIRSVW